MLVWGFTAGVLSACWRWPAGAALAAGPDRGPAGRQRPPPPGAPAAADARGADRRRASASASSACTASTLDGVGGRPRPGRCSC